MACSGNHFLIVIYKDTWGDHGRNIAFSWNLNLFLDGRENKSRQDGSGQRLCGKWNFNVLPNGTKNNFDQNEDG